MKFKRVLKKQIVENLKPGRVVIVYGPRQAGKTTLVKDISRAYKGKVLFINADNISSRTVLESQDISTLRPLVGNNELVIIDEAQRIKNIGLNLKILVDEMPKLKLIVTGSSSFELANKISEPLTGRKITFMLYPISLSEVADKYSDFELNNKLNELLIYGQYPKTLTLGSIPEKIDYLSELSTSYLYKDVLELQQVRKSAKVEKLLKLVALQVGSEVSLSELSNALDIDKATVARYLDLLEKSFVLFSLSGFSRNLRKEVTKSYKYYFYDLGIRNAIIDNFNLIENRTDIGALWENYLIAERVKHLAYRRTNYSRYFWRTYSGAEVDYVEEKGGKLHGYEFKWGNKPCSAPALWRDEYDGSWELVNRSNWLNFAKKTN